MCHILGRKLFFKFMIDLACYLKTLLLTMNDGLLEDIASHKHIKWGIRTIIMHINGSANNFTNQSFTNLYLSQVPILAPPHYVSHPTSFGRSIQHVVNVSNLKAIVPTIEINLPWFYSNKITHKTRFRLKGFD